jgi:hypothetical protein
VSDNDHIYTVTIPAGAITLATLGQDVPSSRTQLGHEQRPHRGELQAGKPGSEQAVLPTGEHGPLRTPTRTNHTISIRVKLRRADVTVERDFT